MPNLKITPLFAASTTAPAVTITLGQVSPTTIFSWRNDSHCDRADFFLDQPARAFMDDNGTIHLLASSSEGAFQLLGARLAGPFSANCQSLLTNGVTGNQQQLGIYPNYIKMAAWWSVDGQSITALVVNQFKGQQFINSAQQTDFCPVNSHWFLPQCQYWNILAAASSDRANHFQWLMGGQGIQPVIVSPYRYSPQQYQNMQGMPALTNIIQNPLDHAYYLLVDNRVGNGNSAGICLFRNTDPTAANNWLGWDGHDFTIAMNQNPYINFITDPQPLVCKNLPSLPPAISVTSVSYYPAGKQFILLATTPVWPAVNNIPIAAFVYFTSPDLIHWSQPALLMPVIGLNKWLSSNCTIAGQIDPSLLDPTVASSRINFDQVGGNPYLYYVLLNASNDNSCVVNSNGDNRDLVRVPLIINPIKRKHRFFGI